jgi:ribA/ribD-fused uncharacterized protein
MDNCSYFIVDKALFGSYPNQDNITELESNGVRYFVDLTVTGEKKITPYKTQYTYIHFPLEDHKAPSDWILFAQFILYLSNIISNLKDEEKLLINCKAGIGRSGLVVASILCHMKKLKPEQALELTTKYFRERLTMNEKLRNFYCPNTYVQRTFIYKFFKPVYFYKAYKTGFTTGFSNFSLHPVNVPELGIFPTAEAAFQAMQDPDNFDYVTKLKQSKTPSIAKKIGKLHQFNLMKDKAKFFLDENRQIQIMKQITFHKFKQNKDALLNLLSTGLRPIIDNNKNDNFWGIGPTTTGKNLHGQILEEVRIFFLNTSCPNFSSCEISEEVIQD